MKITIADLRGENKLPRACSKFRDRFLSDVGDESADVEWTLAAQMLMLADPFWRQGWGWAVSCGYIPAWSMCRVNLHRANLYKADLYRADLYEADLEWANLHEANLSEANLGEANLHVANLSGANLQGANLWGTDLYRADLQGANLWGADLCEANLSDANLRGALWDKTTTWPDGFQIT